MTKFVIFIDALWRRKKGLQISMQTLALVLEFSVIVIVLAGSFPGAEGSANRIVTNWAT